MPDESNTTFWGVLSGLIAVIGTVITTWIINVRKGKSDADKEVKIAEINSKKDVHEETKQALKSALDSIKELQEEIKKEVELKRIAEESLKELERKFKTVKVAFRLILKQYSIEFKNDPDQLELLKEFDLIIEKE